MKYWDMEKVPIAVKILLAELLFVFLCFGLIAVGGFGVMIIAIMLATAVPLGFAIAMGWPGSGGDGMTLSGRSWYF